MNEHAIRVLPAALGLILACGCSRADAPAEPQVVIDADGTTWCTGTKLYWPGIDPGEHTDPLRSAWPDWFWMLAERLETEVVPGMAREEVPYDPSVTVPSDPLRVRCHPDAHPKYFERVAETCHRDSLRIFRFLLDDPRSEEPIQYRTRDPGWNTEQSALAVVILSVASEDGPRYPKLLPELGRGYPVGRLQFQSSTFAEHPEPYPLNELKRWVRGLPENSPISLVSQEGVRMHQVTAVVRALQEEGVARFFISSPLGKEWRGK